MKIGMIGFGSMGQALARGWLDAKTIAPQDVYACAAHFDALQKKAEKLGIHAMPNAKEVIEAADVIILAVKPNKLEEALEGCTEIPEEKMVVSLAAGKPFKAIEALLPGSHHISIMPNTPVMAGQGIVIAETENTLDETQKAAFDALFSAVALVEYVDAAQFSIAGTLAGCSPAFAAMFIEALADAGVKYGLKRNVAYALAAKVLEGTGALYFVQESNPSGMKDAVCSPGGTTIKGVSALEKRGFRGTVIDAIDAIEGK